MNRGQSQPPPKRADVRPLRLSGIESFAVTFLATLADRQLLNGSVPHNHIFMV